MGTTTLISPPLFMSTYQRLMFRAWWATAGVLAPVSAALAQNFGGDVPAIPGTPGPEGGFDVRATILRVLAFVLNFLALVSVIFIIVAGIRLIVSQGEEEQKNKAKKTILYVIFGLLVILFARVIVGFFTTTIPNEL